MVASWPLVGNVLNLQFIKSCALRTDDHSYDLAVTCVVFEVCVNFEKKCSN